MKKLLLTFLFCCLGVNAADVQWTLTDYVQNPLTPLRRIYQEPLWYLTTSGTNYVTGDRRTITNGTPGVSWNATTSTIIVSNIIGGSYRTTIPGPFRDTLITNTFPITNIFLLATDYSTVGTNAANPSTAYGQAEADARFLRTNITRYLTQGTNIVFVTNGTNLTIHGTATGGGGGTSNWTDLTNKPAPILLVSTNDASTLSNLNASSLASGTVADTRVGTNVVMTRSATANTHNANGNLAALLAGTYNTAIGKDNFRQLLNGDYNTAFGFRNFGLLTNGSFNLASGWDNFASITNGSWNTGLNEDQFVFLLDGSYNFGSGDANFMQVLKGNVNSGLGVHNFHVLTNGNHNFGAGEQNFNALIRGEYNVGIGLQNFLTLTQGWNNVALGFRSGDNIVMGTNNFFFGGFVQSPFGNQVNGTLNLGNLLYGTGMYNSFSTPSMAPSGGKVGINTTNLTETLNVGGSVNITGTFHGNGGGLSNVLQIISGDQGVVVNTNVLDRTLYLGTNVLRSFLQLASDNLTNWSAIATTTKEGTGIAVQTNDTRSISLYSNLWAHRVDSPLSGILLTNGPGIGPTIEWWADAAKTLSISAGTAGTTITADGSIVFANGAYTLIGNGGGLTNIYGSNITSGAWVSGLLGFNASGLPLDNDTPGEFETAMGGVNFLTAPELTTSASILNLISDENTATGGHVLFSGLLSSLTSGDILSWGGASAGFTNKAPSTAAVAAGTNGITATTNAGVVTVSFSGEPTYLSVPQLNVQTNYTTNFFVTSVTSKLLKADSANQVVAATSTNGAAGQVLTDNGSGLFYWSTPAGTGDMAKSTYDTNNNGVVDIADFSGTSGAVTNQETRALTFNGGLTVTNNLVATNVITAGLTNYGPLRNVGDLAVTGTLNLATMTATNANIGTAYITNATFVNGLNPSDLVTNTPTAGELMVYTSASTARSTSNLNVLTLTATTVTGNGNGLTNLNGNSIFYTTNAASDATIDFTKPFSFLSTNNNLSITGRTGYNATNFNQCLVTITNTSAAAKTITMAAKFANMNASEGNTLYCTNVGQLLVFEMNGTGTNFYWKSR